MLLSFDRHFLFWYLALVKLLVALEIIAAFKLLITFIQFTVLVNLNGFIRYFSIGNIRIRVARVTGITRRTSSAK